MKGKILFAAGLAAGYVLGARAGRSRYEQIARGARAVWHSKPVQAGAAKAGALVNAKAPELVEFVADTVRKAAAKRTAAAKQARAAKRAAGTDAPAPATADPAPTQPAATTAPAGKPAAAKPAAATKRTAAAKRAPAVSTGSAESAGQGAPSS